VQYASSSTEIPTPIQQSSFQKYATTLQSLPAGQNFLGLPHDTLSFNEVHKHQQRETSQHLVPPPPPLQQTEETEYSKKQKQIQETWQKLLREQQQQQDNWSPLPQPTEPPLPAFSYDQQAPFSGHSQLHNFRNQGSRQQQSQTEGSFRPNTSPHGDNGRSVGVVYRDNGREVSNLYTNLPSTADPSFNNQHASDDYSRPPAAALTSHRSRQQQPNSPNKNLTEKLQRNIERSKNNAPAVYPPSNTQGHFAAENDGSQPHAAGTHEVVLYSDTTSTPYDEYESVKLPMQTNNGKPETSDYQYDVYNERKPMDYSKKSYYDDEEVPEDRHPRLERPEPATGSETDSDTQQTRARSQVEIHSMNGRKQPHYKAGHSKEKLPQNQNRQPERQEPSEQTYDESHDSQKLPQREGFALPNQSGSYKTETFESDSDQKRTTLRAETATEDSFPHPPPEFYEDFGKFRDIENPFASLDFDFDAYLDTLRGNPSQASQQQSSKQQEIKNKEPPEVTYEIEDDSNEYTTHQNVVSTTTTGHPIIQQQTEPIQPVHIKPSRQTPSQGHTTEYIKEYYPPHSVKHVNNEDIQKHSEQAENQSHVHKQGPNITDTEIEQGNDYQKDHVTTTHTPQPGMVTVNRHMNPNPLTVPFYSGEDGIFYASPGNIQSQQLQTNHAGGSRDIQAPKDMYYKYSVQDDISDVIQSTEKVSHIISTSESYLQPHSDYRNSKGNVNNHGPYKSTVTTPFPAAEDTADTPHPGLEVVTTPSRGSKSLRRGSIRNRQQDPVHVYRGQTTGTRKTNDNTGNNTYYNDSVHQKKNVATQRQMQAKVPLAIPALAVSRPSTATASRSNKYQYQETDMLSTEFTPIRQVASLTQSNTKEKKMGHSHIQASVEENNTIKPLRDVKNERILQRHKPVTTAFYTSTVPSTAVTANVTTEYLSTSSATQYNDLETYNNWQDTTPYQKEFSNFELTIPKQTKYKVTDNTSESRFSAELDFTTPTLPEYTTVKLTNIPATRSTNARIKYSGVQTSERPSNELLESIYDIANTMFKAQYDSASENVYFEPSSESAKQDSVTELILLYPNITTTTIPSTSSQRPKHWRLVNKIPRPPAIINHVTKYSTSSTYHTTPETYTIRHRPSKDHPSLPVRQRIHRPQTMSLPSTAANVIITTALPSNDIDTTFSTGMKSSSPTRGQSPVTSRRLRRPTKTRVDMTSTEVYTDSDNSESFERPLPDVNRLNKKQQGGTMTAAPQRYSIK
jgi:hypothetical protein